MISGGFRIGNVDYKIVWMINNSAVETKKVQCDWHIAKFLLPDHTAPNRDFFRKKKDDHKAKNIIVIEYKLYTNGIEVYWQCLPEEKQNILLHYLSGERLQWMFKNSLIVWLFKILKDRWYSKNIETATVRWRHALLRLLIWL